MFLLLLLVVTVNSEPCDPVNSVDITNGETLINGEILKDGVKFGPQSVYSKNISGEIKTFGCMCKTKQCFRKCCPLNSIYNTRNKTCEEDKENNIVLNKGLDLYFLNGYKEHVQLSMHFKMLYGKPCVFMYLEDPRWYLQQDGQLYVEVPNSIPPWMLRSPDQYCIDTFVYEDQTTGEKTTKLDALICFREEKEQGSQYIMSSSCMLISCVFILATLAVYAWLPELRNLHGMVLMMYLLCFFVAFMFLASMQILLTIDRISQSTCVGLTIIIYFGLVSAFFWLNVMCFDIWWTFSGKRGHTARLRSTKARFLVYCLYAFGFSTLLTILVVSLEFSGLPPHALLPLMRHQGCFLYGTSKLIYLYGPMIILCVANIIFFALTALKIYEINKQTSVLKSKDNTTHDKHRSDKQRLFLYLKLFMVMGINWIMEVVSAVYPEVDYLWKITDTYNVLIGFIIFVIFVCKRKIFRLIKKRWRGIEGTDNMNNRLKAETPPLVSKYKQLRGEPMSRTQTTISSRTMSSKEEVPMNAVKN